MAQPSSGDLLLSRPHAVPALLALAREGPLNAMAFIEAAEYNDNEAAQQLRDELEAWGLLNVEPATVNGKPGQVVSLTSAGEKVAALLEQIGPAVRRVRVLRALYELQAGPLTTRSFAYVTRYTMESAKVLREDMEAAGLVRVANADVRGAPHRIELTAAGRKAAELCAEVVRIVNRSAKKDA